MVGGRVAQRLSPELALPKPIVIASLGYTLNLFVFILASC
jgi:hypothetical protein